MVKLNLEINGFEKYIENYYYKKLFSKQYCVCIHNKADGICLLLSLKKSLA